MTTKNTTDFSAFIEDTDTINHPLAPIQEANTKNPQKEARSIHTKKGSPEECPKCKGSDYHKNGKIKVSKRQRNRCNNCSTSFSLSANTVNTDRLFDAIYDEQHKDQPYMLNTKYRKVRASKIDKRYTRFFDGRLKEMDFENRYSREEIIEKAFNETNLYMDKLEVRLLSKQKDTFAFFLNYPQSDIAYSTEYEHYKLVRNHDINNYSQTTFPLFFCVCGSSNIGRYGSNNNGHSRLKCKLCGNIFVIKLKNIITEDYFIRTFIDMFNNAVPNYLLVDELAEQMYHDFFHTKFYTYFESMLNGFNLITHRTRYYIVKLFINMQHIRYGLHMDKHANRYRKSRAKVKVSNIKYFSITKDLSFLENDSEAIDYILKNHKGFESLVPELFDENELLKIAVEDILAIDSKRIFEQLGVQTPKSTKSILSI